MFVNSENTASQQLSKGLRWLKAAGVREPSRNGTVLVAPTPVLSVLTNPRNRVIVGMSRNANPFFHLMEALWMLNGQDDLPWLAHFNKRIAEYSDDGGQTQPGAYGFRWRNFFQYDQLALIIDMLKKDPTTRRAVLTMWDAGIGRVGDPYPEDVPLIGDLQTAQWGGKDVPCNTHAYFDLHGGALNMTVCCRSNDIWWGAHGANVVHFSFLLEYMAAAVGVPMGVLRQFSNNYHLYTDVVAEDKIMEIAVGVANEDFCATDIGSFVPIVGAGEAVEDFDLDLTMYMTPEATGEYRTKFFVSVVLPMRFAWDAHKRSDYTGAMDAVRQIAAADWRVAAGIWIRWQAEKKGQ